jgi:hypothetical protein
MGAIYMILPNKANFSESWRMWIGLMDRFLDARVRQFVTWLCFGCLMGSVAGFRGKNVIF